MIRVERFKVYRYGIKAVNMFYVNIIIILYNFVEGRHQL
jgi:hypothetical protein